MWEEQIQQLKTASPKKTVLSLEKKEAVGWFRCSLLTPLFWQRSTVIDVCLCERRFRESRSSQCLEPATFGVQSLMDKVFAFAEAIESTYGSLCFSCNQKELNRSSWKLNTQWWHPKWKGHMCSTLYKWIKAYTIILKHILNDWLKSNTADIKPSFHDGRILCHR
jgi:hypothetical protein